jgi:hypothetical protein
MCPRPIFDPGAAQALRQAQALAGGGMVTAAEVRLALDAPDGQDRPPTHLSASPQLQQMLERARQLAACDGTDSISRTHLRAALVEAEALQAGLDLGRLRSARCWVERTHGSSVAQRRSPVRRRAARTPGAEGYTQLRLWEER